MLKTYHTSFAIAPFMTEKPLFQEDSDIAIASYVTGKPLFQDDTDKIDCSFGLNKTSINLLAKRIEDVVGIYSKLETENAKLEDDTRGWLCCFRGSRGRRVVEEPISLNHRIREVFEQFYDSFDDANLGVILHSGEGHFIGCNPHYTRMLGYSAEDLNCVISIDKMIKSRSKLSIDVPEEIIHHQDGFSVVVQMTQLKIMDLQGQLICLITQICETEESSQLRPLKKYLKEKKILIVDDTSTMRKLTEFRLKREIGESIEYSVVEDGAVAVKLFQEGYRCDCVLMDLSMPTRGSAATREIRKISGCEALPIIAWTSDLREDCEEEIRSSGMSDYCDKTCHSSSDLLIMMDRLIRDAEAN